MGTGTGTIIIQRGGDGYHTTRTHGYPLTSLVVGDRIKEKQGDYAHEQGGHGFGEGKKNKHRKEIKSTSATEFYRFIFFTMLFIPLIMSS